MTSGNFEFERGKNIERKTEKNITMIFEKFVIELSRSLMQCYLAAIYRRIFLTKKQF